MQHERLPIILTAARLPGKAMFKLVLLSGLMLILIHFFAPAAQAAAGPVSLDNDRNDSARLHKAIAKTGIYHQLYQESLATYDNGDKHGAYRLWFMLARKGHVDSQYLLGTMYMHGKGVKQDQAFAIHWYSMAASNGHLEAQYNLGIAYAKGVGVTPNIEKAIGWWKAAAKQGSPDAQYNLGLVYSQGFGVKRNAIEALHWYSMAAVKGDPAAQYNLGVMYARGEGVQQNIPEAIKWWNRSANQGFKHAQNALKLLGVAVR